MVKLFRLALIFSPFREAVKKNRKAQEQSAEIAGTDAGGISGVDLVLIKRIYQYAQTTPNKTALCYNGKSHSYAIFAGCIEHFRRRFIEQQVRAGTVAVLCIECLADAWVIGIALRSLGVTTISARNAEEIIGLGLPEIAYVVAMAVEKRPELAAMARNVPWQLLMIQGEVGTWSRPDQLSLINDVSPGGHITRTSGTTGLFKKFMRDPVMETELMVPLHAEINGITEQSIVYVMNFPLRTAGGYAWPLLAWSQGATVIIHQRPDRQQPLWQNAVTHMFTTPALLVDMLKSGAPLPHNDQLKLMVAGGVMPTALARTAKSKITTQLYSYLGCTEAWVLGLTPINGPEDLQWHQPVAGKEVQVVDEAGKVLPPGQVGLLRTRIIDGVSGYLYDEAASREFFRDGYFYTGDLAEFRADGRLTLHGRQSDVINVLGRKIATGPLESTVQNRLDAEAVCIVCPYLENGGVEIHVVIQSSRPIAEEEWKPVIHSELERHFGLPVWVSFVQDLPRNEMGKIQRKLLVQQILDGKAQDGTRQLQ